MTEYLVIDEAWSKTPPGQLGAYHGAFVYISRDASKCASDTYVAALHAAGKGVGFVFEDAAGRWRGGNAAGRADGLFANTWADAHGVPAGLPLYAAVDQDVVTAADFATALAYIQGFGSVKRSGRGYGEYDLIERLAAAGIDHGWQACAWSGSRISSHAAVYQRLTHTAPTVPGSYDEDIVLDLADAGLWFVPSTDQPSPQPIPQSIGEIDMRVVIDVSTGREYLTGVGVAFWLSSKAAVDDWLVATGQAQAGPQKVAPASLANFAHTNPAEPIGWAA